MESVVNHNSNVIFFLDNVFYRFFVLFSGFENVFQSNNIDTEANSGNQTLNLSKIFIVKNIIVVEMLRGHCHATYILYFIKCGP